MLSGELRELEAERLPVPYAAFEIVLDVEALRALLQLLQLVADAVDLVLGSAVAQEVGADPLDGAVDGVGSVVPVPELGSEAVALLLLGHALVELRGVGGRLHHQAVEVLDLVTAGRARQMLLLGRATGQNSLPEVWAGLQGVNRLQARSA